MWYIETRGSPLLGTVTLALPPAASEQGIVHRDQRVVRISCHVCVCNRSPQTNAHNSMAVAILKYRTKENLTYFSNEGFRVNPPR